MSGVSGSKMRALVRDSVSQLTEEERREIQSWAHNSLTIVQSKELSPRKRYALLVNRQTPRSAQILMAALFRLIKAKAWTGQSWARRLGVVGAAVGGIGLGGKAAGLATMGMGLSVSLPFISTVIATFLGVIIDEIGKEVGPPKKKRESK